MRHESSAITVASAMSARTARQVVSVLHGTDSFTFFSMNTDSLLRTKENIVVVRIETTSLTQLRKIVFNSFNLFFFL